RRLLWRIKHLILLIVSEPTAIDTLPNVVKRLYDLVAELERSFPDRPFTPDGHLVGSLGEVLASHYYHLKLPPLHRMPRRTNARRTTRASQSHPRKNVALRSQPDHLLVLLLQKDGTIGEIYNGPGTTAWQR